MIFVTVGNAKQGFKRLLEAIDEFAGNGMFKSESVIIQSGSNRDFHASHCTQRDFFPPEEFSELINNADLIVCHGGAGTLHYVFQAGKVPVVMPRRRKYGEHLDDQFELVKALNEQARIVAAFEPSDLAGAIHKARNFKLSSKPAPPDIAIRLIEEAIDQLVHPRHQRISR